MGFFSGLTKTITGGADASSSSSSGFALLPPELQAPWKNYGNQVNMTALSPDAYKFYQPDALNDLDYQGIRALQKGFTPNQATLNSDIAMQTNPFDSYVIDGINREAMGNNIILRQAQSEAGQFGSNRGMLGANDIDLSRLQQIGQFKQSNFNTALQNALTELPRLRAADATASLQAADIYHQQAMGNKLAPITALQQAGQLVGVLPQSGGSESSSKSSQSNGIGQQALSSFFSDIRLKENITPLGERNGLPWVEFNYIGNPRRYEGTIAQEVMRIAPEAVSIIDGFMAVDYNMLGLEMVEVGHA